jgi:hypothetical protein
VRSARHRWDAADAGQIDPRVVVAAPRESAAAAERREDVLDERLGQRPAKETQQRERELVDADVVVFPVRARRAQRPRAALRSLGRMRVLRDLAPAIDGVGQAERPSLPLARLRQQLRPGDGAVVLAVVEADARQPRRDAFVLVGE